MSQHSLSSEISNLSKPEKLGIVACGALAREIEQIIKANRLEHISVRYLPAKLHNTPQEIPDAVDAALSDMDKDCDALFVGYGDCGTAGKLDVILKKHNATRLKGSHCYEFYAGTDRFEILHDAEPGTFYLTDYLARQFDNLVYKPLGLDRHPQLLSEYFGNYTRLLYLAQGNDSDLDEKACDAARRLGLRFERIQTGFGLLESTIISTSVPTQKMDVHS